jgi:hypothetical protein
MVLNEHSAFTIIINMYINNNNNNTLTISYLDTGGIMLLQNFGKFVPHYKSLN